MVSAKELMITDYPKVKANDRISTLLGLIRRKHQHWAVVVDEKGSYLGMADKKWLMRSRIDIKSMKVKHCVVASPRVASGDDLQTLLRKFTASDLKALPVFKGKQLTGVVSVIRILSYLKSIVKKVKVSEVMPRVFITINETEEIGRALNIMIQKKFHHVPVVDSYGKLVGIVSLADILERQLLFPKTRVHISGATAHQQHRQSGYGVGEKRSILFLPVNAVMSRDCCSCSPEDSLGIVIDQMLSNNHSTVIVTENQTPVGIITVKDILVKAEKLL